MFTRYSTRSFVFKNYGRGEVDQFFVVFSKDFGKLTILAKAARKIASKLKGGMDLFSFSEMEFIQGKHNKTLVDARSIRAFPEIKKDLKASSLAFRMAELFDQMIGKEEPDKNLWMLLKESFGMLGSRIFIERKDDLVYYYFFWNLAAILGFKPALHSCAYCQGKIASEDIYFDSDSGGVVCSDCFKKERKGSRTSQDVIKIIRIILEKRPGMLARLKLSEDHFSGLKKISEEFRLFLEQGRKT